MLSRAEQDPDAGADTEFPTVVQLCNVYMAFVTDFYPKDSQYYYRCMVNWLVEADVPVVVGTGAQNPALAAAHKRLPRDRPQYPGLESRAVDRQIDCQNGNRGQNTHRRRAVLAIAVFTCDGSFLYTLL
ncbi:MAG: hypothetical protein OSB47_14200 [Pirellulaceae bacterium]|nr:hypothetical protein [Pirellulaceae bacterium]